MKQLSVFWGMERKRKTKPQEEKNEIDQYSRMDCKIQGTCRQVSGSTRNVYNVRELLVLRIHRNFRWMSSTSAGRRILHFGLNRRIIIQSESCDFTVGNILPHNDQS